MVTITLSTTTLVEIFVAVTFIGGVIFISTNKSDTSSTSSGGKKSKSKKKKSTSAKDDLLEVPVPAVVIGGKKKKRVNSTPTINLIPTPPTPEPQVAELPSIPTVVPKTKATKSTPPTSLQPSTKSTPSFASIASSSSTPPQSKPQQQQKTAAESHYVAPPSTSMDDMRDEEHDPSVSISRVMRIVDGSARVPKNYQLDEPEYDEWGDLVVEEAGWETAKPKKPANKSLSLSSKPSASSAFAASNPAPRTIPGMAPPTEQLTKKQRENSKKSGRVAAEKEEAEKERLDRLASHRRELDRARIMEAERERNKTKPKIIRSENVATSRAAMKAKEQSGGMSASLDNDGKLIWE